MKDEGMKSVIDVTKRIDAADLFVDELDERREFEALATPALVGVNFGCNGDICIQTICPIPPA